MTSAELHIDLDLKLQKLNSNATKNIEPEEKDWLINNQVSLFLDSRTRNLSDEKRLGLHDDFKRLKDISGLIKEKEIDVIYNNNLKEGKVILPSFLFKPLVFVSEFFKDCLDYKDTKVNYKIKKYLNFKLPIGKNFKIEFKINNSTKTLFNSTNYEAYTNESLYFYMIEAFNNVIREYNKTNKFGVEFYYENYGSMSNQSSFFITGDNSLTKLLITEYDSDFSVSNVVELTPTSTTNKYYTKENTNTTAKTKTKFKAVPNIKKTKTKDKVVHNIKKSKTESIAKTNFDSKEKNNVPTVKREMNAIGVDYFNLFRQSSFSKSTQERPIGTIINNELRVINPQNTIINRVVVRYIKQPKKVNVYLNNNLEFNDDICKEIINDTVTTIKGLIDNNMLSQVVKENKLIE